MTDFTKLIENIPDYQEFLTVDEMDESSKRLAEEYPDVVSIFEEGRSRKGHPIYCLKIGNGSHNGFMFGCPHPNEPMGAMMLEYFSRAVAEDDALREELDFTWYLIKCIDVDGTKLNENWFKGPFTITDYTRNYFRPAGYEQAEWTFPLHYKNYDFDSPIPETQILMDMIDEVKPEFMYSLHNAGFCGTYWYLTKEVPELWDKLHNASLKQGIPIHLGEPEVNYVTAYAPAIFPMIKQEQEYDYYEKYGELPPEQMMSAGASSGDYSAKYGTLELVTELPYFYSDKIQSRKIMDFTRREAVLKKIDYEYQSKKGAQSYYDQVKYLTSPDNPFAKMVEISLDNIDEAYEADKAFALANEEYSQPCRESEAFDNLDLPKFHTLFLWTLCRRSCEFELSKDHSGEEKELLSKIRNECEKELDRRARIAEADIDYTVTPIKKIVSIQLESGMIVADYVRSQN